MCVCGGRWLREGEAEWVQVWADFLFLSEMNKEPCQGKVDMIGEFTEGVWPYGLKCGT